MQLRLYQKDMHDLTIEAINKHSKVCLAAPCGSGKTIIARFLIDYFLKQNKRIAFMVNRTELVGQTWRTFKSSKVSILKAGEEKYFNPEKPVQIIMLQTWYARRNKNILHDIDYVIWDEAHQNLETGIMAETFIEHFENTKIIGLTATPITADGYKLEFFDKLIDKYSTRDLQKLGFLVKDRWFSSGKNLNLQKLSIQGGDYVESELNRLMSNNDILQNVFNNFMKHARDKKTIIFAVSIEHAEAIYKTFKEKGFSVDIIHSKIHSLNKRRGEILGNFKSGKTQILVNVGILTTGFDETSVECIVLARPTRSLRLYIQMAMRGLRLHIGKTECLILDCANNVWEHGLATEEFDFNIPREQKIKRKQNTMRLCPMCESANPYTKDKCISCGFEFFKNKQEFNYKIVNEDIVEINVHNLVVRERGYPDLKHVVELFMVAKRLNTKTANIGDYAIKKFITELHKKYNNKFDSDLDFFNYIQKEVIKVIRLKHSFYKIRFSLRDKFEVKNDDILDKLRLIRGHHSSPCPDCNGIMRRNNSLSDMVNDDIYQCEKCHKQYCKSTLERKKDVIKF